jgi:hypothetical protein
MPSFFLRNTNVTDLNRQTAWETLTTTARDDILKNPPASSATGTGGTTGTGNTGTGSGTTTPPKASTFASRGGAQAATLPSNAFEGRLDYYSAVPTAQTLQAFQSIWKDLDTLDSQLTQRPEGPEVTADTRGAIFVDIAFPRVGQEGRIANPYGSVAGDGTFTPTGTATRAMYDAFENEVRDQQLEITKLFGGSQGLLGYDANDNGRIDDESELFGFNNALDLDGFGGDETTPASNPFFSIQSTAQFGDRAVLNDDVNYATSDPANRSNFNRFMLLTGDGNSFRLNNFNLKFNSAAGQYVTAQSLLNLTQGASSLSIRTESGFNVSLIA